MLVATEYGRVACRIHPPDDGPSLAWSGLMLRMRAEVIAMDISVARHRVDPGLGGEGVATEARVHADWVLPLVRAASKPR